MGNANSLSIVICTRNRPDDLKKCLYHISRQKIKSKENIEVIIIDDGETGDSLLKEFKSLLHDFNFKYIKKGNPGLFLSRIKAISIAQSDVILFLDDDVELNEDYLRLLKKAYLENPNLVGISGIDILLGKPNFLAKIYHTLFLLKSCSPGKLSLTGYGDSMQYWSGCNDKFYTEFLSGCNMSFKKKALSAIQPIEWLKSYSIGEDVYLSYIASRYGRLVVEPNLKVVHHKSPVSRDNAEDVAFNDVINHHYLLKIKHASKWKIVLHGWTIFGILLKSAVMLNFPEIKGYLKGIVFLFSGRKK